MTSTIKVFCVLKNDTISNSPTTMTAEINFYHSLSVKNSTKKS